LTPAPHKPSITFIVSSVVRENGVAGLWRGMTPSLVRTVPGVAIYFGIYDYIKTRYNLTNPNPAQSFLHGATCRSLAAAILMPASVIKARYESGLFQYKSVTHAFIHISKNEGRKGLWSGMVATVLRDVPYSGFYLMFYTRSKEYMKSYLNHGSVPDCIRRLPLASVHFACSIAAGISASAVTQPLDVIKTQMQVNPGKHKSTMSAATYIFKSKGGLRAFFAGFVPRTMRRTLMTAATWTVYEQLMSSIGFK